MGSGDNGRESLEEALERTIEELSLLIGKKLVGVALSTYALELVFEDCRVVAVSPSPGIPELRVSSLEEGECRCLKECLEKHGIGREETQDCMDACIESTYEEAGGGED
ncbi:hypothetical protein apy_08690 [Aeropyrum pernix]|uniref:Plant antimicrobial peptide domain-containing protein n=1 Tax=Aeropyrum pernix TaxID=56636 RepID=A0A401H9R9_AERPX|nr:hypothetical protein [Aeropyrum pernix]GBF09144.1 hypothetical protein apy_08690 [Aeropyrum pernix]